MDTGSVAVVLAVVAVVVRMVAHASSTPLIKGWVLFYLGQGITLLTIAGAAIGQSMIGGVILLLWALEIRSRRGIRV